MLFRVTLRTYATTKKLPKKGYEEFCTLHTKILLKLENTNKTLQPMKTVPSKNKHDEGKKICNKTVQVELNMLKEETGDAQKLRTERDLS